MATDIVKKTCTTSRAMLGNSTTSLAKAKTPRTCGTKTVVDSRDIVAMRNIDDHQLEEMTEEILRYRTALAEARARIADLEKYIVDELLKKAQVK
jgi:hypothetical protein